MKISKTHSVRILKLNTHRTSSGRYYSTTCFAHLPNSVFGLLDKSGISANGDVDMLKVGFIAKNIRIEHDELLCDIEFLNGKLGDAARAAFAAGYNCRAVSLGNVDMLSVVSNAHLLAVYLTLD